jgi:hypothetical protein
LVRASTPGDRAAKRFANFFVSIENDTPASPISPPAHCSLPGAKAAFLARADSCERLRQTHGGKIREAARRRSWDARSNSVVILFAPQGSPPILKPAVRWKMRKPWLRTKTRARRSFTTIAPGDEVTSMRSNGSRFDRTAAGAIAPPLGNASRDYSAATEVARKRLSSS